jgi:uncharacterized protein (TIGR03000 family)
MPDPNAQVWFEGSKTQQTGTTREFESPQLTPGHSYVYHIRGRWMENGQTHDETRNVTVTSGEWRTVDFSRPEGSASTVNNPPSTQAVPAAGTPRPEARPAVNPNPVPAPGTRPNPDVTTPNGERTNPPPAANPEVGPDGRINNPKE